MQGGISWCNRLFRCLRRAWSAFTLLLMERRYRRGTSATNYRLKEAKRSFSSSLILIGGSLCTVEPLKWSTMSQYFRHREGLSWYGWRDIQNTLVSHLPRQSNVHTHYYQGNLVHSRPRQSACAGGYQYSSHPCMWILQLRATVAVGFIATFFSWDIGSLKIWSIGAPNSTPEEEWWNW